MINLSATECLGRTIKARALTGAGQLAWAEGVINTTIGPLLAATADAGADSYDVTLATIGEGILTAAQWDALYVQLESVGFRVVTIASGEGLAVSW